MELEKTTTVDNDCDNNLKDSNNLSLAGRKYNIKNFYRSIYEIVNVAQEKGLVIYGAGFLGEISRQIFALFDVVPLCFCDDAPDKQGTYVGTKIPVISLDEAAEKFPEAVYFAAASNFGGGTGIKISPRSIMNQKLKDRNLLSEYSGFHPSRYLFLLEGGFNALNHSCSMNKGFGIEDLNNILVFNNMGSSGGTYFQTLVNGHPNIVHIPMFCNELYYIYEQRLKYLEGKELVIETVSQMQQYLSSEHSKKFIGSNRYLERYVVNKDGEPEERIFLAPELFVSALFSILKGQGCVDFATLLKAIFAAYANASGKEYIKGECYWIFFDTHTPNYTAGVMDDILAKNFKRVEYLFILREPVQQIFSYIRLWDNFANTNAWSTLSWMQSGFIKAVLSCSLGLMFENEKNKKVCMKIVRFEDVKNKTVETMTAFCKWLGISFDECMLDTTINGITVYYPSLLGSKNVISASGKEAVNRKDFSAYMSSFDIFRLNFAFQDVKRAYGYDCDVPHYSEFSEEFIDELYSFPFRFEKVLDKYKNDAWKFGMLKEGEDEKTVHDDFVKIFIQYMKIKEHRLLSDMLLPDDM